MGIYLVRWSLHVEADSPEEAAHAAREEQLQPNSLATQFVVEDSETGDQKTVSVSTNSKSS